MKQTTPILSENISKEVVRGTLWNYLSFASGRLLNFISTLILARLLVPEQFGLVAYCTITIQYLEIINTLGIDSALIARKEKVEEAASSAYIANIFMGGISYVIAWLTAPSVASVFGVPEITPLIRLLAINLPISGLSLVPYAMLLRGLRFRVKLIPDVAGGLSKGLTSIILAILGFGPWSLIWGQIVGQLIDTFLVWCLVDWRPTWKFDKEVARDVIVFGGHIMLVDLAGQLCNNIDYIIVGRVLGAALLGIYTLAYRIPELIIRSMNNVVEIVSFPLLSQIQLDIEALRSTYFGYIRYIALFSFSMGFGLALTARLFVDTFLPEKWLHAGDPMALVSIALAISSIGRVPGILYKAINRPEILNLLSLIKIPIVFSIVWYATPWGIVGVAFGQILFACIILLLDGYMVSRIIGFKMREMWQALVPALICSASMVAIVSIVQFTFLPSGLIGLTFVALVGAFTFLGTLGLVDRSLLNQAFSTLRKVVIRS